MFNEFSTKKRSGPVLFSYYSYGEGIKKAIEMGSDFVLNEIDKSKLRGRGGAGFPTVVKWKIAANDEDEIKYVICNADEGEPGTFKDRVLLMEYPELVFDGMVVAARTIGAKRGIVYLRGEYSYMLNYLESYLQNMRNDNLLGDNILGNPDFSFDITIRLGSGAYVCGEETALIESLEGYRGEPRNRPPYPGDTGFLGHPTIVNNVETFAAVSHIVIKGGEWFKKYGTDKSTGSKLFSISGDCKKPGVYELPWGITIREILNYVDAKDTKAVQVGGASGVCIPENEFDRKLAYEDAATGGSIMIFDKSRKMIDILENFMDFFVEESCGQCTPCRIGNVKLLEGVRKIKNGNYTFSYINTLKELCQTMKVASKCGLGQTSPNPFLTILNNFKDEIFHTNGNGVKHVEFR